MRKINTFLTCLALVLTPFSVAAEMVQTGVVTVQAIGDGPVLKATDGREIRLSGILIPKPVKNDSKQHLRQYFLNQELTLSQVEKENHGRMNRYGQSLAHVFDKEGLSLQEHLLQNGLALVATTPTNAERATALYTAENSARQQKHGIWAKPGFDVRNVDTIDAYVGTFQIVEATVLDVQERRDRTYLNFGDDWRTDFTISLKTSVGRKFSYDLQSLNGQKIQVRGIVGRYNGPFIEVSHPEQIQVLNEE